MFSDDDDDDDDVALISHLDALKIKIPTLRYGDAVGAP